MCVKLPFIEHRWRRLNQATCDFVPNFDSKSQRDAHDGDKGAAAAHKSTFTHAKPFLDYLHRKDYIEGKSKSRNGGGKAGAACYVEAFNARSLRELVRNPSSSSSFGECFEESHGHGACRLNVPRSRFQSPIWTKPKTAWFS